MYAQWLAHEFGRWLRHLALAGRQQPTPVRQRPSARALHGLSRHLQRDIGLGALP